MSNRNMSLSASVCAAIALAAPMIIAAQSYPEDVGHTSAGHRDGQIKDAIGRGAIRRLLRGDSSPLRMKGPLTAHARTGAMPKDRTESATKAEARTRVSHPGPRLLLAVRPRR